MSRDKPETRKPYADLEASHREWERIDWSTPNEENGYYPHGTRGSRSWLKTRKKGRTEIAAESLTSRWAPFLLELPRENPFASVLSDEEWEEARKLAEDEFRQRALRMVEKFHQYARFGEDKDLQTAVQNTEREDLEEYAKALRYAALAFGDLAHGLERGRQRKRLAVAEGDHE
jgi:hypothetical protein